jgi:hypothetical protein
MEELCKSCTKSKSKFMDLLLSIHGRSVQRASPAKFRHYFLVFLGDDT